MLVKEQLTGVGVSGTSTMLELSLGVGLGRGQGPFGYTRFQNSSTTRSLYHPNIEGHLEQEQRSSTTRVQELG